MDHINWEGMQCYMTKLKIPQSATATKYIHGWLLIQFFFHKQCREFCLGCPACKKLHISEIIKCLLSWSKTLATAHSRNILQTSEQRPQILINTGVLGGKPWPPAWTSSEASTSTTVSLSPTSCHGQRSLNAPEPPLVEFFPLRFYLIQMGPSPTLTP